jgi:hypothetical protein
MKLIATSSAQHRGGESGAPVKEMVMNARDKGLKVIHGSNGKDVRQFPTSRLQVIAAAIGLAVLLAGGASTLPQSDSDRANGTAEQPGAAEQSAPAAFIYFPAQYVNQATEAEEHIEAF